jgi:hypothetical protein
MIPCPRLPIFIYGSICSPIKLIALAGKIEGSMVAKLPYYKQTNNGHIIRSEDPKDQIPGEILWVDMGDYDNLIKSLDEYNSNNPKEKYERFSCEPITNEPVYRAIKPSPVKCWSYKIM